MNAIAAVALWLLAMSVVIFMLAGRQLRSLPYRELWESDFVEISRAKDALRWLRGICVVVFVVSGAVVVAQLAGAWY